MGLISENLAGKTIFVASSDVTDPFAAMSKMNDAQSDQARVQERVAAGFIVTCNADSAADDDAECRRCQAGRGPTPGLTP